MSTSSISLNEGLSTSNTLVKKRYLLINVLVIWASLLPVLLIMIAYFSNRAINHGGQMFFWYDVIVLPLSFLGWWALFTVFMIFFSTVAVKIMNLFCKPKEGVFSRFPDENGKYDRDYRYWSMRNTVKKSAVWATHFFPLPWIDLILFKMLGIKVQGDTTLMDSWISTEFIEFGPNVLIGSTSVLLSGIITGDKLIIKKIKIGAHVVIGGACLVSPGTVIGDNVMLGARSTTKIDQVLESGWIYFGCPATKLRENNLGKKLEYKETKIDEEGYKEKKIVSKPKITDDDTFQQEVKGEE